MTLTEKVRVVADKALSEAFPGIQAAVVSIKANGKIITERVDFPKGEPENPLTEEEFRNRYDDLMSYAGIDGSVSSKLFGTVYRKTAKVEELVKQL